MPRIAREGEILVPGLQNEIQSARLLATGEELEFEKTDAGVEIELPEKALDPNATVIKIEVTGEPKIATPSPSA